MQGIYYNGFRLASKKLLKQHATRCPGCITIEATALFGREYDGCLTKAPDGKYYVTGPDPRSNVKWEAVIIKVKDKIMVK